MSTLPSPAPRLSRRGPLAAAPAPAQALRTGHPMAHCTAEGAGGEQVHLARSGDGPGRTGLDRGQIALLLDPVSTAVERAGAVFRITT